MWAKFINFLREVRAEFTKVSWPTREDLINSTRVVLIFSAVFAVIIGLFDLVISRIWVFLLG
jgi:preprotein translocase subunit SecE